MIERLRAGYKPSSSAPRRHNATKGAAMETPPIETPPEETPGEESPEPVEEPGEGEETGTPEAPTAP